MFHENLSIPIIYLLNDYEYRRLTLWKHIDENRFKSKMIVDMEMVCPIIWLFNFVLFKMDGKIIHRDSVYTVLHFIAYCSIFILQFISRLRIRHHCYWKNNPGGVRYSQSDILDIWFWLTCDIIKTCSLYWIQCLKFRYKTLKIWQVRAQYSIVTFSASIYQGHLKLTSIHKSIGFPN